MPFIYYEDDIKHTWKDHSFDKAALKDLEVFVGNRLVLPLLDLAINGPQPNCVYMRHDVDHSLEHALKFAQWEYERLWRSSYFLLHSRWYFNKPTLYEQITKLMVMGHEVGIHNDAMCTALLTQREPVQIMLDAHDMLQRQTGVYARGVADHGGSGAVNGDLWDIAPPTFFGFKYEAYQLKNSMNSNYISDNRGQWQSPLEHIDGKVTHMLIHPCHWDVDSYYD